MSNLNHKGPSNLGPKTGKKLGKCRKTDVEKKEIDEVYIYNKGTLKNLNEKDSNTNNGKQ